MHPDKKLSFPDNKPFCPEPFVISHFFCTVAERLRDVKILVVYQGSAWTC
jgi:hypothetical protein